MIRWLVQTIIDHPDLSALRPPAGLLTAAEADHYATLRSPQRRRDWLLGRWTAKHLVQQHIFATQGHSLPFNSFSLTYNAHGAPILASHHPALQPDNLAIAISHSHGYACSALTASAPDATRIGIDIELVEPRPATFVEAICTPTERANLNAAPPDQHDLLITALWSVKEATLKATHAGLGITFDASQIECILHPAHPLHWTPLRVILAPALRAQLPTDAPLRVWWRILPNRLRRGTNFVLTLAAFGTDL